MVVVNELVDVVEVGRAGAARVDRFGDVLERAGELRLVAGRLAEPRRLPAPGRVS